MENNLDFNRDVTADDDWCSVIEGPMVVCHRNNGRYLMQNPQQPVRKVLQNRSRWCEVLSDHAYPLRIGSHLSTMNETQGKLHR